MNTHTNATRSLPWRIEEIDFDRIDLRRATANEDLLLLVCAASFTESGSDLYTRNLVDYFNDDPEVSRWLAAHWECEELQHGRALKTYIHHVWPGFDWDRAFTDFFSEFSKLCTVDQLEKTRALEMAARCVVETGTATLYRAIHAWADEPVLKEITDHIRSDEVRHYKYFYKYFHKYNAIERNGRRTVLKTLMRRAFELRDADTEITLRHAFFARHPETAGDCAQFRPVAARVNKGVRRHLPAEMCVKMLLKPLALPAWLQPVVQYPATKLTQYVLLR